MLRENSCQAKLTHLNYLSRERLKWGEGFSGTTIKDTWTKPRGRVEARERDGIGWGWGGVVVGKCRQV